MLSRTAESFFWIGRYIERAEYTARYVNVHYHLLLEIATHKEQMATWRHYLKGAGEWPRYLELYDAHQTKTVLEFLTLHPQNPNSLVNLIREARTNARGIQDQVSSEVWHQLNEFYLTMSHNKPSELWLGPHRIFNDIQNACYTLDGVIGGTMLHDEGWNFYRLGKNVERASRTIRLLNDPILIKAAPEPGAISEHHRCLAILKSASALEAYRKFYSAQPIPRKIVRFLLFYDKFPRSVRFATNAIKQLLVRLTKQSFRPETRETERLAGQLAADFEFGSLEEAYRLGLSSFLTQVINQLDQLTNHIGIAFFRSPGYSDVPTPLTRGTRSPRLHSYNPAHQAIKAILSARHHFLYTYTAPVSQVSTIVRVAPPEHYGRQHRLDLRWQMDPPAHYRHFTDAFGNLVWQLDHLHIEKEISCTVEMRIETQAWYRPDQALLRQGLTPHESDCTVKPEEFIRLTPLVDSSDALQHLANRSKQRGLPPAELVESLLHQVYAHMRYQPGATHIGTTASQAFQTGEGVCQDYAHIMLSLCRQAGLPARYVSGYLPGEGQMHAWVEVLVPVGPNKVSTWVAYDPTHQKACDEQYITVAIGRDYQDIAPTSGFYKGSSENTLFVSVSVLMESHGTDGNQWLTPQMTREDPSPAHEESQQQ